MLNFSFLLLLQSSQPFISYDLLSSWGTLLCSCRGMLICSILCVFSLEDLHLLLTSIFNMCRNDCGIRGLQFIIQSTVKVFSYVELGISLKEFLNYDICLSPAFYLLLSLPGTLSKGSRHFSKCLRPSFMR